MKKSKGFTLIELMIVVAIIGILSAIAIPKFADLIRRSNEGATKGNLGAIRSAISIYYGEMEGQFPVASATETLNDILTMDNGKYLKDLPACYCPPYHPKSNLADLSVSTADCSGAGGGQWGYQEDRNASSADGRTWGDVWVNCTHTDSKSTDWGSY
jgi:prepilin-type N-terminal cleavage/methylation domain-containing protein